MVNEKRKSSYSFPRAGLRLLVLEVSSYAFQKWGYLFGKIYISKIVWFLYDYGMMVWKWYDCMTSVWWFVRCVCEWRIANSCEQRVHTLFLVFFKLRNTTQSTSLIFRFVQLFHLPTCLENILKTSEDQFIKPSAVIRFDVVYPRVSLKTLKSKSVLFYSFFYQ